MIKLTEKGVLLDGSIEDINLELLDIITGVAKACGKTPLELLEIYKDIFNAVQ